MTGPTLGVSTDRLSRCEPAFIAVSNRVQRLHDTLDGRLRAIGDCWGDDDTGEAFAENYAEPAQQMTDALTELVEVLSSVADGIRTMAKGAAHAEEQAEEQANDVVFRAPTVAGSPAVPATTAPGTDGGRR